MSDLVLKPSNSAACRWCSCVRFTTLKDDILICPVCDIGALRAIRDRAR